MTSINKTQAKEQLAALEVEVAKLRAIIDAPKPRTGMIPDIDDIEVGTEYWVVSDDRVHGSEITGSAGNYHKVDVNRIAQGSAFYDKESANLELRRRKLHVLAKQAERDAWLASGDELRLGDGSQGKYSADWDYEDSGIYHDYWNYVQTSHYNFPTKESCKAFFNSLSLEDAKILLTGRV